MNKGKMQTIKAIPKAKTDLGSSFDPSNIQDPYWKQNDPCAGPEVSKECEWRYDEMQLLTFTPQVCASSKLPGCEDLVAYVRINIRYATKMKAIY